MKMIIFYFHSLSFLLLMRYSRRVQLTIKKRKRRKQTLLIYLILKIQLIYRQVIWTSQKMRRRKELRILRQSFYLFLILYLLLSLSVNCQHCFFFYLLLLFSLCFSFFYFSLLLYSVYSFISFDFCCLLSHILCFIH